MPRSTASLSLLVLVCWLTPLCFAEAARAELGFRDAIGQGQIQGMGDLAVARNGNIFLLGTEGEGALRVRRFDASGAFVTSWGNDSLSTSAAPGKFNLATDIAVDTAGDVYVADWQNNRVQKFSPAGQLLALWGRNRGDGSPGSGPGEFDLPGTITISPTDVVYVGDMNGVHILTTAGVESGRWPFAPITGLAAGESSTLYVASGPAGVARVSTEGGQVEGRFATASGRGSDVLGNVSPSAGAQDLAVDSDGRVWVTDPDNSRVQQFSAAGRFVAACGQREFGPFKGLLGVAAGSNGDAYVGQFDRIDHLGDVMDPARACDRRPPRLVGVELSSTTIRLTRPRRRAPRLRLFLSEPARLRLAFTPRDLRETCDQRTARQCRARNTVRMTVRAPTGLTRISVTGRVGRQSLRSGRYTLTVSALDVAGHRSRRSTLRLSVLR